MSEEERFRTNELQPKVLHDNQLRISNVVGMETTQNAGYFTALELFNDGRYFEAHEAWEEVWRLSEEPERRFLQGLIQAAVAMHHYQNRNLEGAISLASRALQKLNTYPAIYAGINVGAFRSQLAAWLDVVKTGASPDIVRIHVLVSHDESGDADL